MAVRIDVQLVKRRWGRSRRYGGRRWHRFQECVHNQNVPPALNIVDNRMGHFEEIRHMYVGQDDLEKRLDEGESAKELVNRPECVLPARNTLLLVRPSCQNCKGMNFIVRNL